MAFVGCVRAAAGPAAVEAFGCSEERPSPAVAVAVAVAWIDEILGDNAASHLQACDVGIETATHLGSGESTGGTQLAGYHTPVGLKYCKNSAFNGLFVGSRMAAASPVAEVGSPLLADESGLAVEKLAIEEMPLVDGRPFPFPQWPLPAAVVEHAVAAFGCNHCVGRKAVDAAVEQWQVSHPLYGFH